MTVLSQTGQVMRADSWCQNPQLEFSSGLGEVPVWGHLIPGLISAPFPMALPPGCNPSHRGSTGATHTSWAFGTPRKPLQWLLMGLAATSTLLFLGWLCWVRGLTEKPYFGFWAGCHEVIQLFPRMHRAGSFKHSKTCETFAEGS